MAGSKGFDFDDAIGLAKRLGMPADSAAEATRAALINKLLDKVKDPQYGALFELELSNNYNIGRLSTKFDPMQYEMHLKSYLNQDTAIPLKPGMLDLIAKLLNIKIVVNTPDGKAIHSADYGDGTNDSVVTLQHDGQQFVAPAAVSPPPSPLKKDFLAAIETGTPQLKPINRSLRAQLERQPSHLEAMIKQASSKQLDQPEDDPAWDEPTSHTPTPMANEQKILESLLQKAKEDLARLDTAIGSKTYKRAQASRDAAELQLDTANNSGLPLEARIAAAKLVSSNSAEGQRGLEQDKIDARPVVAKVEEEVESIESLLEKAQAELDDLGLAINGKPYKRAKESYDSAVAQLKTAKNTALSDTKRIAAAKEAIANVAKGRDGLRDDQITAKRIHIYNDEDDEVEDHTHDIDGEPIKEPLAFTIARKAGAARLEVVNLSKAVGEFGSDNGRTALRNAEDALAFATAKKAVKSVEPKDKIVTLGMALEKYKGFSSQQDSIVIVDAEKALQAAREAITGNDYVAPAGITNLDAAEEAIKLVAAEVALDMAIKGIAALAVEKKGAEEAKKKGSNSPHAALEKMFSGQITRQDSSPILTTEAPVVEERRSVEIPKGLKDQLDGLFVNRQQPPTTPIVGPVISEHDAATDFIAEQIAIAKSEADKFQVLMSFDDNTDKVKALNAVKLSIESVLNSLYGALEDYKKFSGEDDYKETVETVTVAIDAYRQVLAVVSKVAQMYGLVDQLVNDALALQKISDKKSPNAKPLIAKIEENSQLLKKQMEENKSIVTTRFKQQAEYMMNAAKVVADGKEPMSDKNKAAVSMVEDLDAYIIREIVDAYQEIDRVPRSDGLTLMSPKIRDRVPEAVQNLIMHIRGFNNPEYPDLSSLTLQDLRTDLGKAVDALGEMEKQYQQDVSAFFARNKYKPRSTINFVTLQAKMVDGLNAAVVALHAAKGETFTPGVVVDVAAAPTATAAQIQEPQEFELGMVKDLKEKIAIAEERSAAALALFLNFEATIEDRISMVQGCRLAATELLKESSAYVAIEGVSLQFNSDVGALTKKIIEFNGLVGQHSAENLDVDLKKLDSMQTSTKEDQLVYKALKAAIFVAQAAVDVQKDLPEDLVIPVDTVKYSVIDSIFREDPVRGTVSDFPDGSTSQVVNPVQRRGNIASGDIDLEALAALDRESKVSSTPTELRGISSARESNLTDEQLLLALIYEYEHPNAGEPSRLGGEVIDIVLGGASVETEITAAKIQERIAEFERILKSPDLIDNIDLIERAEKLGKILILTMGLYIEKVERANLKVDPAIITKVEAILTQLEEKMAKAAEQQPPEIASRLSTVRASIRDSLAGHEVFADGVILPPLISAAAVVSSAEDEGYTVPAKMEHVASSNLSEDRRSFVIVPINPVSDVVRKVSGLEEVAEKFITNTNNARKKLGLVEIANEHTSDTVNKLLSQETLEKLIESLNLSKKTIEDLIKDQGTMPGFAEAYEPLAAEAKKKIMLFKYTNALYKEADDKEGYAQLIAASSTLMRQAMHAFEDLSSVLDAEAFRVVRTEVEQKEETGSISSDNLQLYDEIDELQRRFSMPSEHRDSYYNSDRATLPAGLELGTNDRSASAAVEQQRSSMRSETRESKDLELLASISEKMNALDHMREGMRGFNELTPGDKITAATQQTKVAIGKLWEELNTHVLFDYQGSFEKNQELIAFIEAVTAFNKVDSGSDSNGLRKLDEMLEKLGGMYNSGKEKDQILIEALSSVLFASHVIDSVVRERQEMEHVATPRLSEDGGSVVIVPVVEPKVLNENEVVDDRRSVISVPIDPVPEMIRPVSVMDESVEAFVMLTNDARRALGLVEIANEHTSDTVKTLLSPVTLQELAASANVSKTLIEGLVKDQGTMPGFAEAYEPLAAEAQKKIMLYNRTVVLYRKAAGDKDAYGPLIAASNPVMDEAIHAFEDLRTVLTAEALKTSLAAVVERSLLDETLEAQQHASQILSARESQVRTDEPIILTPPVGFNSVSLTAEQATGLLRARQSQERPTSTPTSIVQEEHSEDDQFEAASFLLDDLPHNEAEVVSVVSTARDSVVRLPPHLVRNSSSDSSGLVAAAFSGDGVLGRIAIPRTVDFVADLKNKCQEGSEYKFKVLDDGALDFAYQAPTSTTPIAKSILIVKPSAVQPRDGKTSYDCVISPVPDKETKGLQLLLSSMQNYPTGTEVTFDNINTPARASKFWKVYIDTFSVGGVINSNLKINFADDDPSDRSKDEAFKMLVEMVRNSEDPAVNMPVDVKLKIMALAQHFNVRLEPEALTRPPAARRIIPRIFASSHAGLPTTPIARDPSSTSPCKDTFAGCVAPQPPTRHRGMHPGGDDT